VDGFVLRYFLIELIRVLDGAVFNTGSTAPAFIFINVPGLPGQGYFKVSCFTFDFFDFGVAQDLYVLVPADLDQFGREYSHRAVVGGEGLIELSHMAADGR